jgi:hypothetical protein
MSNFNSFSGQPLVRLAPNRGQSPVSQGIDAGLSALDLAVEQGNQMQAQQFAGVMQALGGAVDVVQTVGNQQLRAASLEEQQRERALAQRIAAENEAERQRMRDRAEQVDAQREQERLARQLEIADKAVVRKAWNASRVELERQIAMNDPRIIDAVGLQGEELATWSRDYASAFAAGVGDQANVADDLDEIAAQVASVLTRKQIEVVRNGEEQLFIDTAQVLAAQANPQDFADAADVVVGSASMHTRQEAFAKTVIPALREDAEAGRIDLLNQKMQAIGMDNDPAYGVTVQELRTKAQAAQVSLQQQADAARRETVYDAINSGNWAVARANAIKFGGEEQNQLMRTIRAAENESLSRTREQAKVSLQQSGAALLLQQARAEYSSATMPSGGQKRTLRQAVVVGDETVEAEVSLSNEELARQIQAEDFQTFKQQGMSDMQAMQRTSERAVANGVPVHAIADNAARVFRSVATLDSIDNPEHPAVAKQFGDVLTQYQALGTAAVTAMGLSDANTAFLDMASQLMMTPDIGNDPARAIVEARRILVRDPRPLSDTQLKAIDDAAARFARPWFRTNFDGNITTMTQDIAALARVYSRGTSNPEVAVQRAVATIEKQAVRYNDNYVRVPGWKKETYGYDVGEVLEARIDDVVKQHARVNAIDGEALEAKHIEVQYNQRNGTFTFHDMRNGFVVNTGRGPMRPMTKQEIDAYALELRTANWASPRTRMQQQEDMISQKWTARQLRTSVEELLGPIVQPIRDARENFGAPTIP